MIFFSVLEYSFLLMWMFLKLKECSCDLSIASEIFQESGFVQRKIHSPDQRVPKHSKQTFCLKQRRRKRIIKNKNSQKKIFSEKI